MVTNDNALATAIQLLNAGQLADAEAICRQIITASPDFSQAWHLLGFIAIHTNRNQLAAECFERAIELNPLDAEVHNNLGGLLLGQHAIDKAIACFRKAIELQPAHAAAHANLAKALYEQQDFEQAIAAYKRAIELNPGLPESHNDLGNALTRCSMFPDAAIAYRRATELRPTFAEAHNNLASVLWSQGRLDQALASVHQAIACNADFAEAHANLANILNDQGKLDEAAASYRQAIALKPDLAAAYGNLGSVLKAQGQLEEAVDYYRRAVELQPTLSQVHSNLLYTLYFCPGYDAAAIYGEHQRWNEQHAQRLTQSVRPHANDRSSSRKLRVGYVSPYFYKHALSLFTTPLLRFHDREQFEIFCYSEVIREDSATLRSQQMADVWRNVAGKSEPGLDDRWYSEESVRLPDSFWCYDPRPVDVEINELPALTNGYITFGSFNNFCKVNEAVLTQWARVLKLVHHSRLLILTDEGSHRERTIQFLREHGVGPDRVTFVGPRRRRHYLELYHQIDVALDTFPYTGHTTSMDALWMGVPLVTLRGPTAVGRGGDSILHNLGMPELISNSFDEFVTKSASLATDLGRLSTLRRTLRERMERSPLMDGPRFARNVEAAYRVMWHRWCETQ